MNLRAVIFDYGEVLSRPANQSVYKQLVEISGLPEDLFQKYYWAYRLDYDAAILSGRTYWEKIAEEVGAKFTPEQIERLIERDARMWMDINEPMLAWAIEIKRAALLTAILSNMGEDVLRAMRQSFPWLAQFDALIWSCELGIVKPDPAIYLDAIEKLGVQPEEALFIDNLEVNVVGAEAAGLNALLFTNIEQLSRDLRQRGFDIPLPQPQVAV
jgi:putative hydrolase of the HAD superfamily